MNNNPNFNAQIARYPITVTLEDGREIELRVASHSDCDGIVKFAKSLSENDLLFLRVDITQPDVVKNWLSNVEAGITVSLIAYDGNKVAGYGTIDRNPTRWTRRVGEIRVNVGADYRSQGLGRHLTAKIFDFGRSMELTKLMAQMTVDQRGAQAAFKRLGFVPEALLTDYVEDRKGKLRDLVLMSYDINGLTDQMDAPLRL